MKLTGLTYALWDMARGAAAPQREAGESRARLLGLFKAAGSERHGQEKTNPLVQKEKPHPEALEHSVALNGCAWMGLCVCCRGFSMTADARWENKKNSRLLMLARQRKFSPNVQRQR